MMCFLPTVSVGHDHPFHGGQAFRSCRRLGEVERHLRFLKKMGKLIETEDVEDSPSRNAGNVIGTPKIVCDDCGGALGGEGMFMIFCLAMMEFDCENSWFDFWHYGKLWVWVLERQAKMSIVIIVIVRDSGYVSVSHPPIFPESSSRIWKTSYTKD